MVMILAVTHKNACTMVCRIACTMVLRFCLQNMYVLKSYILHHPHLQPRRVDDGVYSVQSNHDCFPKNIACAHHYGVFSSCTPTRDRQTDGHECRLAHNHLVLGVP